MRPNFVTLFVIYLFVTDNSCPVQSRTLEKGYRNIGFGLLEHCIWVIGTLELGDWNTGKEILEHWKTGDCNNGYGQLEHCKWGIQTKENGQLKTEIGEQWEGGI